MRKGLDEKEKITRLDERMKEYLEEIERYATEMVNEGYLTREVVDEKRKEANLDADDWVTRSKTRILESSVDDLHDAVFGLHFADFVRNTRMGVAQIKLASPDWFNKVTPSVNSDGTVTITVDRAIQTLTALKNYFDKRITQILDLEYHAPW